jgi:uncharacterized protein (DUF58 family)
MPYELAYRNIFVLPTTFGFGFGAMLAFTALGALNFNNNLALLLVFLLAAVAQATTLLVYRNLAKLGIEAVRAEPVFAGEPAHFRLFLANGAPHGRFSLRASEAGGGDGDCRDLEPHSGGSLDLRVPTRARGWLQAPALRLETRYPIGLFRAWTWLFPDSRCLVYPRPAANPPPLPLAGTGQAGRAQRGEGDQVQGLRAYRPGDSLRRIAWRSSARHDTLLSRELEVPREESCVLAWRALASPDPEERLAVLTAWVLMADHRQLSYTLDLPDMPSITGTGPGHRAACLERLALFGL